MLGFFINLGLSTIALLLTARIVPGFELQNVTAAILACLVIGPLNFVIRPLLALLTLPINIMTLGLFSFVLNAIILSMAAGVIDGFLIRDWVAAIIGALVLSMVQICINVLTPGKHKLLRP